MNTTRPTIWRRVYAIIIPYRARLVVSTVTLLVLTGLGLVSPILAAKLVGVALVELDKTRNSLSGDGSFFLVDFGAYGNFFCPEAFDLYGTLCYVIGSEKTSSGEFCNSDIV